MGSQPRAIETHDEWQLTDEELDWIGASGGRTDGAPDQVRACCNWPGHGLPKPRG